MELQPASSSSSSHELAPADDPPSAELLPFATPPPSICTPARHAYADATARGASSTPRIDEDERLRGADAPVAPAGRLALVEALLKSPVSVLHDIRVRRGTALRLGAVVAATMVITGLAIAAWSPGPQLVLVPLKLTAGIFFCALICLPSLHVFSCLSGAEQRIEETWGALLMGIALMGVLLVGFAPVAWVFSQATSSAAFMGALHLMFLVISCFFGLGLVNRALTAMNRAPVRGTRLWSMIFVLVLFQMTTTLRPLVGTFDGVLMHDKLFFLAHWFSNVG